VAILCSSGTAAANFAPAVIEAHLSRVPLVVLTADRPPELRDVGAAQTIDQIRLYGDAVRLFVELPVPNGDAALRRHAALVAARAMTTAREAPAGPVHINLPFREPLLPSWLDPLDDWSADDGAGLVATSGFLEPNTADLRAIAGAIAKSERGIIVCGPQDDPAFAASVTALAAATDFPILADPLSQVRCGRHDRRLAIDRFDAFLRDDAVATTLAPDFVLRFGAMPTSKALNRFLDRFPGERHVLVDDGAPWRDPIARATDVIRAAPKLAAERLATLILARAENANGSPWAEDWLAVNTTASDVIAGALAHEQRPFEGAVFPILARLLPDGATLFAGNSMPVRDLDSFFPTTERDIRLYANRGANGIDGVVSTALGVAGAGPGPVVLVVGDLSFYHDMNGLLAAKLHDLDAAVVVLDNNGGGIFSFLPQADSVPHARFEQLFGTPTGLDPARVAALYDASFERPESADALAEALAAAIARPGLDILTVRTDRTENVRQHRAIWDAVAARLREDRLAHVAL
ncbi:MAG TPA: 2-succinyl-5-enolpyruvyl-6-hydroxy-3-cyclohexene-1-carboxylic-acid synthase, partial [Thermomicrobiales bacterium]|nr:2-succinyl-5-enolpyruvyl-6-hydroxy-3-cyclohexene-1-carboxylic-acid synthase [Thermomicrobiales bacterium]